MKWLDRIFRPANVWRDELTAGHEKFIECRGCVVYNTNLSRTPMADRLRARANDPAIRTEPQRVRQ